MAYSPMKAALLSGASLLAATAVTAQEIQDEEVIHLGTIEIYGDRNATTLDETQSSVAVVTEEELDSPGTQTLTDTFRRMGNVLDGPRTESGFIIRGINSEGLTPGGNSAPLASLYIDGVQQTAEAARRGMRGLFDVEQVEVFRGPQSTLSGRNALAGAIYVRSKDPDFVESGRAQLTFGEDNRRQAGLAYGGAINDSFAYRISGEWSAKDSDLNFPSYQNFSRLDDLAEDKYYQLRGKLLWAPADNAQTRVMLSLAHGFESPSTDDVRGPDYDAKLGDAFMPVFRDVRETKVTNAGLEVTHDFSDALRLTAQTSFSDSVTDRNSVNYGTPGETFTVTGAFDQQIFSQEVRLNYDDGALRWVAGLYAAHEKNDGRYDGILPNPLVPFPVSVSTRNEATTTNIAAFGEVSYEFAQNWRVIAGGRLDYVDQKYDGTLNANIQAPTDLNVTNSDTTFLPKIGLEWDVHPDHRMSLIYQKGYRPGGAGIQPITPAAAYTYVAEETDNIELSWRGSMMGGRLNMGANVFYMDWKNQQVEVETQPGNPFSNQIVNAASSESYGGELEFNYAAADKLRVFGSIGLLKSKYKDFTLNGQNLAGSPFANAPEQTISLGVNWGASTGWFANGLVRYVGSSYSRLSATAPVKLDSYTTVDAQLGYNWDTVRVTAYANNLLDEKYLTYQAGPGGLATLGARREVGIRLDKTF